jgi:hypothetical protein
MSTRSFIAIENTDKSVTFAYCHFDGYPEGVGRDIVGMGRREIRAIINEGAMSCIGEPYGNGRSTKHAKDMASFLQAFRASSCDYAYVLNVHCTWKFCTRRERFQSLAQELKALDQSE